ncbi:VTC domain-containing protein [Anaerorhabdus sp.]|uniref:VTC domain-containing protein n=1 Tax=Anaerorhabdus sp. TaxID=1872524 RepID=UPI002B210407|nr:VTC domain-containing protein [Anaerorhabdus sp.]MEA4875449.1 VTC domain-containing protein [Anaerorhabdus sp.]
MKIQPSISQIERKYILKEAQLKKFMNSISNKIEEEEHFKYTVYNIYYEPVSSDLISKAFKRTNYKERIRLRSYGIPRINDPVYIEIKEKHQELTSKLRLEMSLDEAYELLCEQHECGDNQIDELLRNSGLIPKLFIGYERVAYCSKFDPKVRITFSMNVRYRNEDFRLCDLVENKRLFNDETLLLEIKGAVVPKWLEDALREADCTSITEHRVMRTFKNIEERLKLSNNLI